MDSTLLKEKKILVIVPAYNEAEAIDDTIRKLLFIKEQFPSVDICVVNDGSTDITASIVSRYHDVVLLNLPNNLGIGGAVQTGYKFAEENNYDIAIQFDADGQHNEKDLGVLLAPLIQGGCDMCVGSRFLKKTDYQGSPFRRIGIYYFTLLLQVLTGQRFTDPTSGFRAVNKKVIRLFSHDYPRDYPEPEVLIYLAKRKMVIKEQSVNMRERQGGQSSITPLKSIYYMSKVTLSILMQKVRRES